MSFEFELIIIKNFLRKTQQQNGTFCDKLGKCTWLKVKGHFCTITASGSSDDATHATDLKNRFEVLNG